MRSASASFVRAMRSAGNSMAAVPNSPSFRSSRRLSSMDPPWNWMNVDRPIKTPDRWGAEPHFS